MLSTIPRILNIDQFLLKTVANFVQIPLFSSFGLLSQCAVLRLPCPARSYCTLGALFPSDDLPVTHCRVARLQYVFLEGRS